MGANIPGKPRALLSYLGGLANYRDQCTAGEANAYEDSFIVNRARPDRSLKAGQRMSPACGRLDRTGQAGTIRAFFREVCP